jgi:hypothetical protein
MPHAQMGSMKSDFVDDEGELEDVVIVWVENQERYMAKTSRLPCQCMFMMGLLLGWEWRRVDLHVRIRERGIRCVAVVPVLFVMRVWILSLPLFVCCRIDASLCVVGAMITCSWILLKSSRRYKKATG